MKSVVTTMTIKASSEKVWKVITKRNGLEKCFSTIETCELTCNAVPYAKRVYTTYQGNFIK